MCNPVAMVQAAGAATQAASSIMSGNEQSATAKANAAIAETQAESVKATAQHNEILSRQQSRAATAAQTAQLASRGVMLNSPAALNLAQDAGLKAGLDAAAIRDEGASRAAALKTEANMYRAQARSARRAGRLNALITVSKAAAQAATG